MEEVAHPKTKWTSEGMFITLGFPFSKQLLHLTGSGLQFGVGTCMQGCEYKFPLLQGCMHSWAR